ncbi:CURVATURE THYLAKOID 1A-like protein [Carex rostrata]
MAATAAYSTAVLGGARLATTGSVSPRSLLLLPRRSICSSSSSSLVSASHFQDAQRFTLLRAKATSEDTSISSDELIADLKAKWDGIENKSTVFLYGGGAIVAVWLSSVVVSAINSVPLLPKVMELVGLGYTAWFVYRYLLFKDSRKELVSDIEELKKKIAGTTE